MCILPTFEASDLKMLKRNDRKTVKDAEAETVEIVVVEEALATPV